MASEFPNGTIDPRPGTTGMVERIKRLLITPKEEWPRIDAEPMTPRAILINWALPLASIGPICGLIQSQLFPYSVLGIVYRSGLIASLVGAVVSIALSLLFVWLWSLVIDALAPNFGGTKNPVAALKVAAYSATAAWLCGIFQILPYLGVLAILGLYSAYLFWIGLPMLMRVPVDKAPAYVAVTVLIGIVAGWVVGLLSAAIVSSMFLMTPGAVGLGAADTGTVSGQVAIPGGGTVDLGKLNEATAKLEAAGKAMEANANGTAPVRTIAPDALQGLLPGAVGGYARTSIESSGGAAAGVGGSTANAQYQAGDKTLTVSITDMGALGNLATLGGALNVQSSKQTTTGYEKTQMVGGRMVSEEWDSQSSSGKYSVMVGSRFMVEARGDVPNVDLLKQAVGSIDFSKLETLAK